MKVVTKPKSAKRRKLDQAQESNVSQSISSGAVNKVYPEKKGSVDDNKFINDDKLKDRTVFETPIGNVKANAKITLETQPNENTREDIKKGSFTGLWGDGSQLPVRSSTSIESNSSENFDFKQRVNERPSTDSESQLQLNEDLQKMVRSAD